MMQDRVWCDMGLVVTGWMNDCLAPLKRGFYLLSPTYGPHMKDRNEGADLRELGLSVRNARVNAGMTLEELAKRAGLSKSVLSQVERGSTNPTLSTLWAISNALGLDPLSLLGNGADARVYSTRQDEKVLRVQVPVMENASEGYRLHILNRPELAGKVELYRLALKPGGVLESSPHARGTVEDLTVLSGSVSVTSGQATLVAEAGETVHYAADIDHSIRAVSDTPAEAILVVMFVT
jgi:transcriptional regulator with XRE-family HTH domain